MKKKIYGIAGGLIIATCLALNVNLNADQESASFLSLSNIEALASDESDDCNYKNGYKAFDDASGGAYNCCKEWINKSPNTSEGTCM